MARRGYAKNAKLPAYIERQIAGRYARGEPTGAMATEFGVSLGTILRIVRRRGGTVRERGRSGHRLVDSLEKRVARRLERGDNPSILAVEFGCDPNTIRNIGRRHGVTIRPRGHIPERFTEAEIKRIVVEYGRGETQPVIAKRYGVSQSTISNLLLRQGVSKGIVASGERHGSWRGGRVRTSGYIGIRISPENAYCVMGNSSGYILEHRLVMARSLGRPLDSHETVHHVNGKRDDNRLENLQLRTGKHGKGHVLACLDCGSHNIGEVHIAD